MTEKVYKLKTQKINGHEWFLPVLGLQCAYCLYTQSMDTTNLIRNKKGKVIAVKYVEGHSENCPYYTK